MPAATAKARRSSRKAANLRDDVVVVRRGLHRARLSLHVHQAQIRLGVGDGGDEVRVTSQRGDVVDHRSAESEASRATTARDGVDGHRLAGEQLEHRHDPAQLLLRATGSDPGLVDSPPTSTSAAPSASIARATSAASRAEPNRPPSEKLSGVTFTTPITAGRGQRSSPVARLIGHGR
jgi:hypothetical protein